MPLMMGNEAYSGFERSLAVCEIDEKLIGMAKERFAEYLKKGVIKDSRFGDDSWDTYDEIRNCCLDFSFDKKAFAGNTQDWSVRHAEDMMACLPLNIASCTADALERDAVDPATFDLLDVICGLNKADGYSLKQVRAFPPTVRQAMATLTRLGGSVLTSGAFIGSDMTDDNERVFTRTVLKSTLLS